MRATRVMASLLLVVAASDVLRLRVGHDESDLAAGFALLAQDVDQLRVLVWQEVERVAEQVDLLLGAADEIPPSSRVDVRAIGEGRDELGRCAPGSAVRRRASGHRNSSLSSSSSARRQR